ncbi:hypothetical protein PMSD_20680 [Paenibacillus macquariensis subsp. defensor]|nr:hypothetical protein PMSD_20680 [Paenibacillus macquariensis subsp. defensor]
MIFMNKINMMGNALTSNYDFTLVIVENDAEAALMEEDGFKEIEKSELDKLISSVSLEVFNSIQEYFPARSSFTLTK